MVERIVSLEGGYVPPGPIVQVGAVSVPITITDLSQAVAVQYLTFWLVPKNMKKTHACERGRSFAARRTRRQTGVINSYVSEPLLHHHVRTYPYLALPPSLSLGGGQRRAPGPQTSRRARCVILFPVLPTPAQVTLLGRPLQDISHPPLYALLAVLAHVLLLVPGPPQCLCASLRRRTPACPPGPLTVSQVIDVALKPESGPPGAHAALCTTARNTVATV